MFVSEVFVNCEFVCFGYVGGFVLVCGVEVMRL